MTTWWLKLPARAPHGRVIGSVSISAPCFVGLLFRATPHHLRHSFALKWYSVGRLLYEARFAHLNEEELRDFRAQFGDTWQLV